MYYCCLLSPPSLPPSLPLNPPTCRFPNGESGLDVYTRVTSFISTMFRYSKAGRQGGHEGGRERGREEGRGGWRNEVKRWQGRKEGGKEGEEKLTAASLPFGGNDINKNEINAIKLN